MAEDTGRIHWMSKIRLDETDKDTRGNRTNRKATTSNMQPASLALVNVYQLINKSTAERFAKKQKVGGKVGGQKVGGVKQPKGPGIYWYNTPHVATSELDGEMLNQYGTLMKREGEDSSTYNKRNAAFFSSRKLKSPTSQEPGQGSINKRFTPGAAGAEPGTAGSSKKKSRQEVEAEEIERQKAVREQSMRDAEAAKESERAAHANNPLWQLWDIVKKVNAGKRGKEPIATTPSYGKYENDPNYRERSPLDEPDRIKAAIAYAQKNKMLTHDAKNPPIVAVQTTMSQPPKYYFIRSDVANGVPRRKKLTKPQMKRSLMKKPVGNKKRKVVMKKKGGKR
jgi:hypothetical protein